MYGHCFSVKVGNVFLPDCPLQEVELLRKQIDHLSEENGKLVGHKNHKQRIEYLVKLKKENTKLQEVIIIFNISSPACMVYHQETWLRQ